MALPFCARFAVAAAVVALPHARAVRDSFDAVAGLTVSQDAEESGRASATGRHSESRDASEAPSSLAASDLRGRRQGALEETRAVGRSMLETSGWEVGQKVKFVKGCIWAGEVGVIQKLPVVLATDEEEICVVLVHIDVYGDNRIECRLLLEDTPQ